MKRKLKGWILGAVMVLHIGAGIAAGEAQGYSDLPNDHWAYANVMALTEKGIIKGYDDGSFKPKNLTRIDEFIVMTLRSEGYELNTDGGWSKAYIEKAKELNLIGAREFTDYTKPITREAMIAIGVRAVGLEEELPSDYLDVYVENDVKDFDKIDAAYSDEVLAGYRLGITTGTGGKFLPKSSATRAEAAAIISRLMDDAMRKPYENRAVQSMEGRFMENYDQEGNLVTDFNLEITDTYVRKLTGKYKFYAPLYREEPLNEFVEISKLLFNMSFREKGYMSFAAGNGEKSSVSVLAYKTKSYHDDMYENPSYSALDRTFLFAERMDFDFRANTEDLENKYSPYNLMLWKRTEHMAGYKDYEAFFMDTYGEQVKALFDYWFEDQSDYAFSKYLNAMSHKGENTRFGEVINGRYFHMGITSGSINLTVSLKRF
ncbi:S-layer homology domain-containing protein [Fusibacter sp. JL298sf-3]